MLNTIHVKYFYDTVRLNSVSKAAKYNCISQSAVSQAISRLEKILKTPLLLHSKRSLHLTAQGKLLFEKAKAFIALHEEILDAFKEKKVSSNSISIACTHSIATSFLCPALSLLKKNHPELSVRLFLDQADSIREKVLSETVDIGIIPSLFQKIGFIPMEITSKADNQSPFQQNGLEPHSRTPVFQLEKASSSHVQSLLLLEGPFCFYQAPSLSETNSLPLLICEEHAECANFHKWHENHSLRPLQPINSWEVIAKMTESGLGIGLLPSYIEKSQMFAIQPCLEQGFASNFKISLLSPKSPAPIVQTVLASLKKSFI